MALVSRWVDTYVIEGIGSCFGKVEMLQSPASGTIKRVSSIRAIGTLATLTNIWFVRKTAESLVTGTPADDYVVADGAAITITVSDTDRSTQTLIDDPPFFSEGLGCIVETSGSAGVAWTLYVTVEFEEVQGTRIGA